LRKFLFLFLFCIIVSANCFAIKEATVFDENGNPVITKDEKEHVVLDNANTQISLPPGLEYGTVVSETDEDVPSDMQGLIVEEGETGNTGTEEDLPEDMKELLGNTSEGNNQNSSGSSGNGTDNNSASEDGNIPVTPGGNSGNDNGGASPVMMLWFILGGLIFILILVFGFYITGRKKVEIPVTEESVI